MHKSILIIISLIIVVIDGQIGFFPDCKSGPLSSFPICDVSLPMNERSIDLVNRMTINEKASWLVNTVESIDRLGLPAYQWWNEALHGVMFRKSHNDIPEATQFPCPMNLAATFNLTLIDHIARIISTEARAANNENITGLDFFTPNLNIVRDPRWGRAQETPGEDPLLTSEYVYRLVTGLQQGEDERYFKIGATCKHFVSYDLELWNGTDRWHFDAQVSDLDLVETYLPPFESCIRNARAASIMSSLNAVNGIPSCANKFFLQTIARDTYDFDGYVVCDCGGIQSIMTRHNYTSTIPDTVAAALHAGVDLDCGSFYNTNIPIAFANKTISETDIDQALSRVFNVLLRLGYFDPPEMQPYRNLSRIDIGTHQAQQLAFVSAQQSLVLLKNVNQSLPLHFDQLINKTIALIGPSANATLLMLSNYHGQAPFLISPLMGFQSITLNKSIDIEYVFGCNISGTNDSDFTEAIELARRADVVIYIGGSSQHLEHEGLDRVSIALPDIQLALVQQLEKVVRSPIHVIIMSGSSLDLSYFRDSSQIGSLIWAGYPGESGGDAIASIVFGQYNPAGRLPITFYPSSYVDQVSMFDMSMRPSNVSPGRTYRFYTGQVVFPFGYGLSFTTFSYSWSNDSSTRTMSSYSIQSLINNKQSLRSIQSFRVNVTNTGTRNGDEVVLGYIVPPQIVRHGVTPPLKQLFSFQRINLNVGETKQIVLPLNIQSILTIAHDGSKWIHPGQYQIIVDNQHRFTIQLQGSSYLWQQFK